MTVPDSAPAPTCCDCGCEDLPLFLDVTQDRREICVVVLMRHVMAACCWPQAGALDEALDGAEAMLGSVEGPLVFAHVLALVHAVRRDRSGDFLFMPAQSERICEDEQAVLALLQAARQKDIDLCRSLASSLARQDAAMRILPAVMRLSTELDRQVAFRHEPPTAPDWIAANGTCH